MLDLLELLGFDFDSLDSGGSVRLQQRIWPGSKPQSVCSYLFARKWWPAVVLIGFYHSRRSWERYR